MKINNYFLILLIACTSVQVRADDYEKHRTYDTYFMEAMLERTKGHHDAAFGLLNHCIEIDSTASEAYYFLAQYYAQMKQADHTLAYFQKAAQLEPDNTDYMETLAQAYIAKERYADAVTVVERLYDIDKGRQDLLEMLYKLHMQQHDYQSAIEVLNRMEAIDGKSERLSYMKSSLYLQQNDHESALQEMKMLSEQYPYDLNYRTLYAHTLLVSAAEDDAERRQQARAILNRVLAEEPNNYRAQVTLRSFYIEERDTLHADSLTRAILLNKETSIDDRISLLRSEIGYSEQHGGDSTRVLGLFREMLAQPEPDADIAEFCAAYMSLKEMPRDSISKMLELVLLLAPDRASARLQLVQYAWEDDDNMGVVELCRAARQYNPEEMAFYYYQGMAYYRQDDADHALESFQNGISVITEESNPAIVSDFYAVMGDLLHQKGQEDAAFAAYDSCLQWKPDHISCLNNYAYYLSEMNEQLEKAEEMSRKAITAEPDNGTYLDTYAWILFMQGRYGDARVYIDQAVKNDTTRNSVILEHAGDIYILEGDVETALRYWQEALQQDPGNKVLRRKIKRKKYIK